MGLTPHMLKAQQAAMKVYIAASLAPPALPVPTIEPGFYVSYPYGDLGWRPCSAQRAADLLARAWDGVRVAHVGTEE